MTEEIQLAQKIINLKNEINEHFRAAKAKAEKVRDSCNDALTEALLCGQKLIEAKEMVGHGKWLAWLEENCPTISQATAKRYVALAKRSHVSDLDATSLRKAYIEAELISDDGGRETETTSSGSTETAPTVESIIKRLRSGFDQLGKAWKDFDEAKKDEIRTALKPFVELYEQL